MLRGKWGFQISWITFGRMLKLIFESNPLLRHSFSIKKKDLKNKVKDKKDKEN